MVQFKVNNPQQFLFMDINVFGGIGAIDSTCDSFVISWK